MGIIMSQSNGWESIVLNQLVLFQIYHAIAVKNSFLLNWEYCWNVKSGICYVNGYKLQNISQRLIE
jgi:hypothetical protein